MLVITAPIVALTNENQAEMRFRYNALAAVTVAQHYPVRKACVRY